MHLRAHLPKRRGLRPMLQNDHATRHELCAEFSPIGTNSAPKRRSERQASDIKMNLRALLPAPGRGTNTKRRQRRGPVSKHDVNTACGRPGNVE